MPRPDLAPSSVSINDQDKSVRGLLVKFADQSSEGQVMWWKKYSGYRKPPDKLKQWTEVSEQGGII